MRKRLSLYILFCLPVVSNAQFTNKFTPDFYAVIDTSKLKKVALSCNDSELKDIKKCWIISFRDINILENNFKKIHKYFSGDKVDSLSLFTFQYLGVLRNSDRCIYINAFPTRDMAKWERINWKTEPINICGGGESFWRALFNIETREFIYLEFNSPK